MQQSSIGKISHRKQNWKSDTPVENKPKESNTKPKNAVHGSYYKINLRKDSCIDIIRINQTKIQKCNTPNSPQEKNKEKQKKVQDREKNAETISTKPSDIDVDVTNRVYIIGDSIVNHIRGMNYHKEWKTVTFLLKTFLVQRWGAWRTTYSLH